MNVSTATEEMRQERRLENIGKNKGHVRKDSATKGMKKWENTIKEDKRKGLKGIE